MSVGRAEEARDCMLDAACIAREAGFLIEAQMYLGDTVADCELALGRYAEAEARSREAIAFIERQPGTRRAIAHVEDTLARVLLLQGRSEEGIAIARRAVQTTRTEGFHFRLLEPLAFDAAHQGRLADAAWLTGHVDAAYAKRGEVRWPDASARRALIDTLLAEGLDRAALVALRAEGASSTTDAAFARAFGPGERTSVPLTPRDGR
jgi:tetratricopeptide (TPR) repeat protein